MHRTVHGGEGRIRTPDTRKGIPHFPAKPDPAPPGEI